MTANPAVAEKIDRYFCRLIYGLLALMALFLIGAMILGKAEEIHIKNQGWYAECRKRLQKGNPAGSFTDYQLDHACFPAARGFRHGEKLKLASFGMSAADRKSFQEFLATAPFTRCRGKGQLRCGLDALLGKSAADPL